MAGKTKKELVNQVLRKLREDELTATQSIASVPYANTIGDFLNDVKEEVEDAWNWGQLRRLLSFTTTAGTSTYNVGGAVSAGTDTTVIDSDGNIFSINTIEGVDSEDTSNERTQVLSVWNTTQDCEIRLKGDDFFNRLTLIGTQQNSTPSWYRPKGFDGAGDKNIELYPVPSSADLIYVWTYAPQDDLTTDSSILTLSCAERAITYGTWAMAISERGEDGGQLYDEVVKKYEFYLSTAISRDRGDYEDEADWVVV